MLPRPFAWRRTDLDPAIRVSPAVASRSPIPVGAERLARKLARAGYGATAAGVSASANAPFVLVSATLR
jgi:hypothetical protein